MAAMFRPMLAFDASIDYYEEALKRGSLLASFKLDGIRATVLGGKLVSRTLKPIRNKYTQKLFGLPELEGVDGELTVGLPHGEGVFARTSSGVMSESGTPDVVFRVFDSSVYPRWGFANRVDQLLNTVLDGDAKIRIPKLVLVKQYLIKMRDYSQLVELEAQAIEEGYEGLIVRDPGSPYKFGRSTAKEGYMGKLKRFLDSEATITGFEELMHNENPQTKDHLGFSVRSSHKANQRPSGMLGALNVQDIHKREWVFNVGSGFDHTLRRHIWEHRVDYLGRTIKYKYLPIGTLELPRHPIFLGFRNKEDT